MIRCMYPSVYCCIKMHFPIRWVMLVQSHLLYVGQVCSTERDDDVFVDVHLDTLFYHRMIIFFFASSHSLLMMMIDKRRMMPLKASLPMTRTWFGEVVLSTITSSPKNVVVIISRHLPKLRTNQCFLVIGYFAANFVLRFWILGEFSSSTFLKIPASKKWRKSFVLRGKNILETSLFVLDIVGFESNNSEWIQCDKRGVVVAVE